MTDADDSQSEINIVPHWVGRLAGGLVLGPLLVPATFSRWRVDVPLLVYSLLGCLLWTAFIWLLVVNAG